jgi:hypothetical protein
MKRISDEKIKEVLKNIQPAHFDWADITPNELIKFRAICDAQLEADQKGEPELPSPDVPALTDSLSKKITEEINNYDFKHMDIRTIANAIKLHEEFTKSIISLLLPVLR